MQLEDIFDYKNQLMKEILTNKTIVHLINEEVPLEQADKLAYTQVFPAEFIPETLHDGSTIIMFDVDLQYVPNKTFLIPILRVWVLAHRSRLRLPDGGGVRTDRICSEICKVINGSRYYGLGELRLSGMQRSAPVTDYNGKCMTFTMKEFNRQHNPKQAIPSNRKEDVPVITDDTSVGSG